MNVIPPAPSTGLTRDAGRFRSGWAAGLLAVGLLVTAIVARHERLETQGVARQEFDARCKEIEAKIAVRLSLHEQILRSAAAFFTDQHINREEWHTFVERQNVSQKLPGIQGIGFAQLIPASALASHIQAIRDEGFPDYHIWPEGARESYTSIVFLEPFSGRNLRAFGYDMFTEAVRRQAMERARDQNVTALSGKVVLVQETGSEVQAGTLMYAPVYRVAAPLQTVAERRSALLGWVYSPYRMTDLLRDGILGRWDLAAGLRIRLEIFDGENPSPDALLYDSQRDVHSALPDTVGLHREFNVESAGRLWRLRFTEVGGAVGALDYSKFWVLVGGGVIASALVSGLALSLANTRRNAHKLAVRLTEDLRCSEERWKFAIEGTGDGVWDWNVVTNKVVFSRRWKAMLGYDEGEIGSSLEEWSKRVHPDDLEAALAAVAAHHEGRTTAYVSEHRVACKDKTWKWILDRGLVVTRDETGKPLRMIGTHSDITERREAEAALRESEAKFAKVFNRAPVLIVLSDLVDGTCIDVNEAALRLSGFSRAEVIGKRTTDLGWLSAADRDRLVQEVSQKGRLGEFEMTLNTKGGEVRYGLVKCEQTMIGGRACLLTVTVDITEAKRAEAALRKSENELNEAQSLAGIGNWEIDLNTNRLIGSANARRIYGLAEGDLTIDAVRAMALPEFRAGLDAALSGLVLKGIPYEVEFAIQRVTDGKTLTLHSKAEYNAASHRVFGVIRDITERVRAEQKIRESEDKLRALFDTMAEGVALNEIIYDAQGEMIDYRILDVNPAFYAVADFRKGHPMGNVATKLYGLTLESIQAFWRAHKQDRGVRHSEMESPMNRKWYSITTSPFVNDRFVTTFLDITERKRAETALRESEEKFAKVFHDAPVAMAIRDLATSRYLDVNKQCLAMLGYTREEVIGRSPVDIGWLAEKEHEQNQRTLSATEGVTDRELRLRRKDGTVVICSFSSHVVLIGGRLNVLSTSIDITERKRAEAALAESDANYRRLFDSMLDGFALHEIVCDAAGRPVDYRYLSVNPAFERLTGLRAAAVVGRTVREIMPQTELRWIEAYGRVALTGEGIEFDEYSEGLKRHFSIAAFSPKRGQFATVFIDITKEKQAEAALRASEERYRSILVASPDDITIADLEGRILMVSPAGLAMFGYERENGFLGRQVTDFLVSSDRPIALAKMAQMFDGIMPGASEYRGLRRDGSEFDLEVNSEFIRNADGQPTSIVFVVRDITARKRIEASLRVTLLEKEALLKEVHHRVKNNLQVITSLLRLENGRSAQPETKSVLNDMQGRIRSMALLHESLYRSGTFAALDLGAYLTQIVVQVFRAVAGNPGAVHLQLDLVSVRVELDQAMPCGLLVNELVSNCLKHGFPPGRTGEVKVELHRIDDGLRLRVSDNGVGLPADFELKRQNSLGLQLVSDLTKQLGGTLEITRELATVFSVTFQVDEPPLPGMRGREGE